MKKNNDDNKNKARGYIPSMRKTWIWYLALEIKMADASVQKREMALCALLGQLGTPF